MKKTIFLNLGFALALAGCASVSVTKLKEAAPKAPDCEIQTFADESEVKRPHETVCLLSAKTGTSIADDRSVNGALQELHPKACECGADAIVILSGETGGYSFVKGTEPGAATVRAIRYTSGAK